MNEPTTATYSVMVICDRCGETISATRHHASDLDPTATIRATEHESSHRDADRR